MNKSNQLDVGTGGDLSADQISIGHDGSADCTFTESFINPYAAESQARASGRSPMPIDPGGLRSSDQFATTRTSDRGTHGQSLSDNPGQTDIAHLEPAKVMAETAKVRDENPEAAVIPRMMSAAEVAEYLRVSVSKVWRLPKRESDFPAPVRIGGSTRWDRRAIDRYLDSLQTRSHSGR